MLVSVAPFLLLAASAAAQSTTTLCVPGLCLDGTSNISIGAVVSGTSDSDQFVLLPGTYDSTTNPSNLHTSLTTSSSRLSYLTGFAPNGTTAGASESIALPLTIALQPGILTTSSSLYRGSTKFLAVPNSPSARNSTTGATTSAGGSLVMSGNVWAAFTMGSSSNSRLVLWDSVADLSQLPSIGQAALTLSDLESTSCSPSCSSNGICTSEGTCVCINSGFTGSSCESCASGFFGRDCQACPAGCDKCDDGATGSGKCLVPTVTDAPSSCSCVNGQCNGDGSCTCNAGWEDASGGNKCSQCAPGFFKDTNGDCSICNQGCNACSDGTGACTQCASGLTVDGNNSQRCVIETSATTKACGDGSFADGASCSLCSSACETCSGSGSSACIQCASSTFKLSGNCVAVDSNGVCSGSSLVANNNKNTCDACPSGCAECGITGFNAASTFDQVTCSKCLPGSYLSNGTCVAACPTGTFVSSADNSTCIACDATCATCAGDSKFCLTCSGSSLANDGVCGSSCPSGTFSSNGACLSCHSDCATCSGAGFNQCTSCSSSRPVLQSSGTSSRCLPTCSKTDFFDTSSNSCKACDSSCSSCSGSGANQCLACSSPSQTLSGGSCIDATCDRGSSVISGLGACLSSLVDAPFVDNSNNTSSTTSSTPAAPKSTGTRLQWWEILLMALGCAFIFTVVLMCWRRSMRKKRAARTAAFAQNMRSRGFLSRGMHWLSDKLFHRRVRDTDVDTMVAQMRATELERHKQEMELLESRARGAGAGHGKWEWNTAPSYVSDAQKQRYDERSYAASPQPSIPGQQPYEADLLGMDSRPNRLSAPSMYSQFTGVPRASPEPRQPVRNDDVPPIPRSLRFSTSSRGSFNWPSAGQRGPHDRTEQPSYDAGPIRQHRTGDSFDSQRSDSSSGRENRNPFRK